MTVIPRPRPALSPTPWRTVSYTTCHYATGDPAAPDRAAFHVGVTLGTWQLPEPLAEALATRARELVAELADTRRGDRVIVTTLFDGTRATVHAVSTQCTQDHPGDLIDPATTAVLREAAARWHARDTTSCPCTSMTLLGDDWTRLRLFLTPH